MRTRSSSFLVAAAVGAATLAGCSGDSTGPGGGDQGVEEQAEFALEFLDGLIAGAPDLANGNLAGAFAKAVRAPQSAVAGPARSHCFDDGACDDVEPSWSEAAGAWTASCATAGAACELSFDFFVQFLDGGGTPQPEPGTVTERIRSRTRIHASFDESAGTFRMDYDDAMEVSGLHAAEHLVAGAGAMTGSAPDQSVEMEWSYGLTFPAGGGCPSGTVELTLGTYTITATYSGSSTYTVVIAENGSVVAEKTGTSQCDRTAANEAAMEEAGSMFEVLDILLDLTADMIPRVPSGPLRLELAPSALPGADLRGGCSCPTAITLEWSEAEQAYVARCTTSEFGCDVFQEVLVRYLDASGEPHPGPDGRTAHVDVDVQVLSRFLVNLGESGGETRIGRLSNFFRNEIDVDATQKPYAVSGAGSHELRLVESSTVLVDERSDWVLELGLPLDGNCMMGTIDLAFGPYDAVSRYDRTEFREWELFRGRESVHVERTGSECR
jgi:hypothetical protein